MLLYRISILFVGSLVLTCILFSPQYDAEILDLPSIHQIKEVVEQFDDGPVFPENTKIERLPLNNTDIVVAWVRVYSRMPPLELVLVRTDASSWKPLLVNKEISVSWVKVLQKISPILWTKEESATDLASLFTRILVDPSASYGRMVSSWIDIPTNLPQSSVYQQLKGRNFNDEQIQSALLARCKGDVSEPRISLRRKRHILEFYSWHFYGGEVTRWRIDLDRPDRSKRKVKAVQVGSYDYYY